MKLVKLSFCVKEKKPCIRWVEKYFKDCLCNLDDEISFGLGLISLVCWGIAEIPQIITNFNTKSGHGVSLLFLLTWVVGDVFNLVGCLLEPATLPTQYYTALLYTATTIVLVLQCVYYDHILCWWRKYRGIEAQMVDGDSKPLISNSLDTMSTPNVPREMPRPRDFMFISARSLAGSYTPPTNAYLKIARSGPSALELNSDSSGEDETAPIYHKKFVSQPRSIPRSVGYGTLFAASLNSPLRSMAFTETYAELSKKRLMHENAYGEWLGWLMAAIYMGGRIPQIWLNIKRGSVEGLNPLMFVFALVANVAYAGSILVRSTKWEIIEANMPWLLDAVVCVALDLFIITQYIFYDCLVRKKKKSIGEYRGGYAEASKAFVA